MWKEHHPKRHALRFKYAWEGMDYVIRTQANFRVQIIAALVVAVLAWLCEFSAVEWAILLLTIGFILALEMINTILEVLVDHLWEHEHPRAKIIKDVAAGTVLVAAFLAFLIGCALFFPHLVLFFN